MSALWSVCARCFWLDAQFLCQRLSRLVLAAVLDEVEVHQTIRPAVRAAASGEGGSVQHGTSSRPQNLPLRARQVSGESRVREYRIVFRFISPQIYKTTYGLTPKQLRLYLEVRSRIEGHGRRAMCTGAGNGVGPGVRHGPGPALPCALPLPCLSWYPARCDAPQRTFVKRLLAAISRELKASSARTKGASTAGADDDGAFKKMTH